MKDNSPGSAAPDVRTFGCRLNHFESAAISEHIAGRENITVINSCAVTAEAERQVRQTIRKIHKETPEREIYVTGCAAQLQPDAFAAMPGVAKVIGNAAKTDPASYAPDGATAEKPSIIVSDIMRLKETAGHMAASFEGRTRAFLEIQNGCNHRCTFCIIPYARGNNRSVPPGEIIARARELCARGYKEIVLTGVDISDYGKDLPGAPTLGALCRRLLKLVPDLARLRLSSVDVAELDNDVLDVLANEERFTPYFHLSLQSGNDMILKRMKRRHLRDDILRFCDTARRLRQGMAFGADIIAGFPTETEAMFADTVNLIDEADLQFLHIFTYSPRPDTPAARMPQTPLQVRKERAARLRAAGENSLARHCAKKHGTTEEILVEHGGTARTADFTPVRPEHADMSQGQLLRARLQYRDGGLAAFPT